MVVAPEDERGAAEQSRRQRDVAVDPRVLLGRGCDRAATRRVADRRDVRGVDVVLEHGTGGAVLTEHERFGGGEIADRVLLVAELELQRVRTESRLGWSGAATIMPHDARCDVRLLDCSRMPEKPWLNSTSGKRPDDMVASRFAEMVNVAGALPFSSFLIVGGTKSRTS